MDRVDNLLGRFSFLVTPRWTLFVCMLGWAGTSLIAQDLLSTALCWWGVALLGFSLYVEKDWLNVFPFPPITVMAVHLFLRWELGGLILLTDRGSSTDYAVWREQIGNVIPINALFTTLFLGIPLLTLVCLRKNKVMARRLSLPRGVQTKKRWIYICLVCFTVAVGYNLVGYFSGTLDRGGGALAWAGKMWRPDTLLSSVIRMRDLFFVMFAVFLVFLKGNKWLWLTVVALSFGSLLIASTLGGRGTFIYPSILMVGGLWMTGISVNRFKRLVICVALLASVSIPVIGVWRADQGFREVGRFDLVGRLNSLGSVELGKHINYDQTLLGREIYASSDPFMFVEPGVSQEPAKTKRLGNLKYMWLPKLLVPWKPVIHDGHLIVAEIRGDGGKPNQKNGVFVSFESITTGGDLYWRFRYPGVVVGGILFGCFYSFLCCVWVKYADLNGRVWQIILACIPATLLQGPPLRSLLETIWTFGYDFPKYILLVIVLSFVIERFLISQEQWR